MNTLTLLSIFAFQDPNFIGTRWEAIIPEAPDIIDYLEFHPDSTYTFYVSEMDSRFYGRFIFRSDTLFLFQERGQYDDEFPENSHHRAGKSEMRLILSEERLTPVYRKDRGSNKPFTDFPANFFFVKVHK